MLAQRVAKLQGRPSGGWTPRADGQGLECQVGALNLDHNSVYGGWDLTENVTDGGGVSSLIGNTFGGRGRLNSHEMESFLLGMLLGLEGSCYWKPSSQDAPGSTLLT